MKKLSFLASLLPCFLLLSSCDDGGAPSTTFGISFLDVSKPESIIIDQLKMSGSSPNDNDQIPEYTLYLRCADGGAYIACAGATQGLDVVKKDGLAYGRLNVPLVQVTGTSGTCSNVEVVFVEKNSDDCPSGVSADDTILGISAAVTNKTGTNGLLDNKIDSSDGTSFVKFVAEESSLGLDFPSLVTASDSSLILDSLYFTEPAVKDKSALFWLVVRGIETGSGIECGETFGDDSGVTTEGIIFGGLGIVLNDPSGNACLVDETNKTVRVSVSLIVLTDNDPPVTISTGSKTDLTLWDLIDSHGKAVEFDDNKGFVRFAQ